MVRSSIKIIEIELMHEKEELEDVEIKEKNLRQDLKETLKKIEKDELKSIEKEAKLKSILKTAKKS